MRKVIALAAVAIALLSGGWTTHVVRQRPGGDIVAHVAEFVQWQKHSDRVVIDGACESACTLMLGIVQRDRICATPRGVFGFHSAMRDEKYSLEGTRFMWFFYEPDVRAALARHGWPAVSNHPDIVPISATELVSYCKR